MRRKTLALSVLAGFLSLSAGFTLAADQERAQDRLQTQDLQQDRVQDRLQTQDQQQIYGSQLMTQEERAEYHARMRNAKDAMEREQIRNEHHAQMQERAKSQGVTLPTEPPGKGSMGTGGGMGAGSGGGMGAGGGMGSGGGGKGR